jgi:hypothetical protein
MAREKRNNMCIIEKEREEHPQDKSRRASKKKLINFIRFIF